MSSRRVVRLGDWSTLSLSSMLLATLYQISFFNAMEWFFSNCLNVLKLFFTEYDYRINWILEFISILLSLTFSSSTFIDNWNFTKLT